MGARYETLTRSLGVHDVEEGLVASATASATA